MRARWGARRRVRASLKHGCPHPQPFSRATGEGGARGESSSQSPPHSPHSRSTLPTACPWGPSPVSAPCHPRCFDEMGPTVSLRSPWEAWKGIPTPNPTGFHSCLHFFPSPPDERLVRISLAGEESGGLVAWPCGSEPLARCQSGARALFSDEGRRAVMAVRANLPELPLAWIRGTKGENMPSQARLTQAQYAVSRERQFTPRLCQTRLAFLCPQSFGS